MTGRFDVEIDDDDLLSDDFSTIQGMAKVVCRQVQTS
jgi:acyl carrier protein